MNVIIDGWAWLDRAALSPAQLHALRARLTIFPKQTSDIAGAKAPEPLLLFRDRPTDGRFGVPRGFYRANSTAAHAEELRVSYGQPMQPMVSQYRAEGPFAAQAGAIQSMYDQLTERPWGGGILCAGCGVGKSSMSVELAHRIGRTTLIVVHKEFFMDQWEQRIRDILPDARIGRIQQDTCDIYGKDFVIAMVQSLVRNIEAPRYPKELADHFGIVITDEVHRVGAESWSKTVHAFNAAYRCGLSATVRRADGADPVFLGHIGPILHSMTADSMKPTLRVIPTGTRLQPIARGTYRVPVERLNSAQVISQLTEDVWRTQVIAEDVVRAARAGRKVMVLSHRLEHLRDIKLRVEAALAAQPAAFPIVVDAYTGEWFTDDTTDAKRTRTRTQLQEAEKANVVMATVALAQEGLDIAALDVLVLVTPLSDAEQAVGRVRRWCRPGGQCARYCPWRAATCQGKPAPVVVDVWDGEVALARRKGQARLKLYRRLGMAIPTPAATVQLALAPARPAHDPR